MEACDVLLTKPGGLTSTEAAAAQLPMVHTRPIPGCETQNARFFAAHGMSKAAKRSRDCADLALALLNDETERERMRQAQRRYVPHDAADCAAEAALSLCRTAARGDSARNASIQREREAANDVG